MHKGFTPVRRLYLLLLCLLLVLGCSPARADSLKSAPMTAGATQNGMVRVRLSSLGNPATLNLTVYGSYTVNGQSSRTLSSGSSVKVTFNKSSGTLALTVNGATTQMGAAFKLRRHETSGQNGIRIAQGRVPGNLYPGDFSFTVKGSTLYVVAYIYIEDYLYGVLPYEMGDSSGLEALKAQAVAARTYTMRAMSASASSLYDVVDTTTDQVYSGTPAGNVNCVSAVDATRGIALKNGSSFTATYYTASNGGQTESIKNAWGIGSFSYLGVKDDPYDLSNPASPKRSFQISASGAQSSAFGSLLSKKAASVFGSGAQVTAVSDVTLHTPKYASPSKLYTKLDVSCSYTRNGQGGSGRLTFDIFSELEGPLGMSINSGANELWSVSRSSAGFTVYARRFGHGIGMSQRGAMYMAQLGYTYDQILAFYFEGCTRVQYTLTRSILSPVAEGQSSQEQVIPQAPAQLETPPEGSARLLRSADLTVSPGGSAISTLPANALVTVYAQSGQSCLVGYGVLCGYVPLSALQVNGAIPASSDQAPTVPISRATVINSTALNLRSAPSLNGPVITTVPGGAVLPILRLEGSWAYTQYGLRAGYVSTDYLSMGASAGTQAPAAAVSLSAQVTTPSGSLNLREEARENARVLRTIPRGEVIAVSEKGDTWCKVTYSGTLGYVMTRFLSFLDGGATPAPTAVPMPQIQARYARVTTSGGSLNLRAAPNGSAVVFRTIPCNEIIPLLEQGSLWCKTTYQGVTGYVMTSFLSFLTDQEALATPSPAPTPIPVAPDVPTPAASLAQVSTPGGSLNLRLSPQGNAQVLTTIPQNEFVSLLRSQGDWCLVTYRGTTGYVMARYLVTADSPLPVPAPSPTPQQAAPSQLTDGYAQVAPPSGSLNLRDAPRDDARVLLTIPRGEIIPLLSQGTAWCQVRYAGQTGFVMARFLAFPSAPAASLSGNADTQRDPTLRTLRMPVLATVMSDASSLNLRAGCSLSAQLLTEMPKYDLVTVTAVGDTWCAVSYQDLDGFCMRKYLEFTLYE